MAIRDSSTGGVRENRFLPPYHSGVLQRPTRKNYVMHPWMAVLQACLSAAVADELLVVNPAARPGKLGGRAAKPIMVFTVDELAHLFQTCQAIQPESYPLLLLLARTGLRIGEALALQAGDVDPPQRQVTVKRTWSLRGATGNDRFNSPKSGKERVVDLTPAVVEAMSPRLGALTAQGPTASLWPNMDPVVFHYKIWRPVMEASGLPYRKPHNLRHTYASLLLAKGISVAYVQAQLGHHSIKVTVDTYGHFIPGARVRFVDQLDDITQASPPPVDDEAKAHKPYGVLTVGNSVRAAEERDISPKTRCSDTAVSCG